MANIHVLHTGSNTSPYDTWAKAATTFAAANAVAVAGDNIFFASTHVETAGYNLTTPGTATNPVKLVSGVPDAVSGITSLSAGARIASATATNLNGCYYAYGLVFAMTGAVQYRFAQSDTCAALLDECTFTREGTIASSSLYFGGRMGLARLRNPIFRFGHLDQRIQMNGRVVIDGGSILSGSVAPAYVFQLNPTGAINGLCEVNGFDFTNLPNTFSLADDPGSYTGMMRLRNCKMPTGWTPAVGGFNMGTRLELLNWGVGDTNYRLFTDEYQGQVKEETTIKCTGGASDGVTGYSWRMTSGANVSYPNNTLKSPSVIKRLAAGTYQATVEINSDGATPLTDKEVWIEIEYLGLSGFPLGVHARDMASVIASAAAQATSTAAWDGDTGTGPNGSTTWNTQKLGTSISVQEAGYVIMSVHLAKPSWTIFVDPKFLDDQ